MEAIKAAKIGGWYRIKVQGITYRSAQWLGGGRFKLDTKKGFVILIGKPNEFKVMTQLSKEPVTIL